MATEDHDFEEINYFNFKGRNSDGTRSLPKDYLMFLNCMPSTNAETLKSLFEAAYLKHDNLADATRH
jgi:uncharacterized protein YllA (UPF0747 family)